MRMHPTPCLARHRARRPEFGQFRYINRDWIAYLIAHDVRNGSGPVVSNGPANGPLCGRKRTLKAKMSG